MKLNVLIGFERSGIIRNAFAKHKFNAWSCDIEASWREGNHLQCDIYKAFNYMPWHLIILHPECTALTVAGNHVYAKGKPKHHQRITALKYVEKLWNRALKKTKCLALENPKGVISTHISCMPKPQYIQPYNFGHNASKNTGLWLANLPNLEPTKYIKPRGVCGCGYILLPYEFEAVGKYECPNCCGINTIRPRWDNQTDSGQNRLGPSDDRAIIRATSYAGIGAAMAKQWGAYIRKFYKPVI